MNMRTEIANAKAAAEAGDRDAFTLHLANLAAVATPDELAIIKELDKTMPRQ